ncbi:MAG: diadenylate cyclase [Microthrixaceae bacterium]|nr:diadenylate cyclase [Microthrixaceae bacterium]
MLETPGRLRRLAEELEEVGIDLGGVERDALVEEVDRALRPPVHERRIPSSGSIVHPRTAPELWARETGLVITRASAEGQPIDAARRFADGLSSWLVRSPDGPIEWLVFNRPAGSERDLGVIARATGATIVQRHPDGLVRVVGATGVLRWDGYGWHHESPIDSWIDVVHSCGDPHDIAITRDLLDFAVHDLGANGIGALLVYRDTETSGPDVDHKLPVPPPIRIDRPTDLAPLRHALAQIDGAAVFGPDGVLRQLGVHLMPSDEAARTVDGFRGTRHTSGLRYSYDDPAATVITVSEDGPVAVFRRGAILGRSHPVV